MGFSFDKFFSGFNIFNGEARGKLLFYGVIAIVIVVAGIGIYHKVFLERSVLVKDGGNYIINEEAPKVDLFNFGCSNLKVELYWKRIKPIK